MEAQGETKVGRSIDPTRILDIVNRHGAAEMAGDLEAVMATLGAHPVYDLYPMNVHIEGREAVREMYAGLLAGGYFAPEGLDHIGGWVSDLGVVREDINHIKLTPTEPVFGLNVTSPKAFDIRLVTFLDIDVDTVHEDELLLKGERIVFDGNVWFSQLGLDPQDFLGGTASVL